VELHWIVILIETAIIVLGIVVGLRLNSKRRINRGICELREVVSGDAQSYDDNAKQHNGDAIMITLSPGDASQVHAILMTHAEMQDARINDSLSLIGRLNADLGSDDPEAKEMIDDLQQQVELFETDADNLKRLANMF